MVGVLLPPTCQCHCKSRTWSSMRGYRWNELHGAKHCIDVFVHWFPSPLGSSFLKFSASVHQSGSPCDLSLFSLWDVDQTCLRPFRVLIWIGIPISTRYQTISFLARGTHSKLMKPFFWVTVSCHIFKPSKDRIECKWGSNELISKIVTELTPNTINTYEGHLFVPKNVPVDSRAWKFEGWLWSNLGCLQELGAYRSFRGCWLFPAFPSMASPAQKDNRITQDPRYIEVLI